ncbi:MAG TPA: hypothetical protein VJU14_05870 [Solirubrobacterales bacterium]|nr:hypothetical protein [Solirubrobacterales bacterium]
MQEHPKGAGLDPAITNHDEDEREEAAILRRVLELDPAALTLDELVRDLTGGGTRDFSELDAVQRGVRDLAGSGLLHRPGEDEMVRPTRSALRFSELMGGVIA